MRASKKIPLIFLLAVATQLALYLYWNGFFPMRNG